MFSNRIDWPCEIWLATPERTESMPRVTRKDGTLSMVTSPPLIRPTTAPMPTPTSVAPSTPNWSTVSAARMPARVTIAPIERSMEPIRITIVSASATVRSTADWRPIFSALADDRNSGLTMEK